MSFVNLQVRSFVRAYYRVYSRLWPDRAHQVYFSLNPAIQKVRIFIIEFINILTSFAKPIVIVLKCLATPKVKLSLLQIVGLT